MDIQRINQYKTSFDSIAQSITDDNGEPMEVWYARKWSPWVVALNVPYRILW